MKKAVVWAGFLGAVLVASVLAKIWDVAWVEVVDPAVGVVDQGIISMTASEAVPLKVTEWTTDSQGRVIEVVGGGGGITMTQGNTYLCPDGSYRITDSDTDRCVQTVKCTDKLRQSGVCDEDAAFVEVGVVFGTRNDEIVPLMPDYALTSSEGVWVKAGGRYKGKMVQGWVPIAVDKEGRVIVSPTRTISLAKNSGFEMHVTKGTIITVEAKDTGRLLLQLGEPSAKEQVSEYRLGFTENVCIGLGKDGEPTNFPCLVDRCEQVYGQITGPCCIDAHGGITCN